MKKLSILLLICITVIAASIFTGCAEASETVSIAERIQLLQDDLNAADYDSVYLNFHPEMDTYYQCKDGTTFSNGSFPESYAPFTFGSPTITNNVATGTLSSGGINGTYTFTMKEDGEDNWKILIFQINSTVLFKGL